MTNELVIMTRPGDRNAIVRRKWVPTWERNGWSVQGELTPEQPATGFAPAPDAESAPRRRGRPRKAQA